MSQFQLPQNFQQKKKQPEYISTSNAMSFGKKLYMTVGSVYLLGIIGGGCVGAIKGFRSSPSPRYRIILNSTLNGSTHIGSNTGNAFAILAMFYLTSYHIVQRVNMSYRLLDDYSMAAVSGALTGFIYKIGVSIIINI